MHVTSQSHIRRMMRRRVRLNLQGMRRGPTFNHFSNTSTLLYSYKHGPRRGRGSPFENYKELLRKKCFVPTTQPRHFQSSNAVPAKNFPITEREAEKCPKFKMPRPQGRFALIKRWKRIG